MQVKGVMIQNIDKVTQRGDKLEDLGERAGRGEAGGRGREEGNRGWLRWDGWEGEWKQGRRREDYEQGKKRE